MRVLLAALLATVLSGCAEPSEAVFVEIHDRTYAPDALTVQNGTAVQYRNVDDEEHTVSVVAATATDGLLDELRVPAGNVQTYTFRDPGAFVVYCRYHGDAASGQRMDVTVT